MTALEIKAIRELPEEYIRDGTHFCLFNGMVVAIQTNLPMIFYKDGKWRHMTVEGEPSVQNLQ